MQTMSIQVFQVRLQRFLCGQHILGNILRSEHHGAVFGCIFRKAFPFDFQETICDRGEKLKNLPFAGFLHSDRNIVVFHVDHIQAAKALVRNGWILRQKSGEIMPSLLQ